MLHSPTPLHRGYLQVAHQQPKLTRKTPLYVLVASAAHLSRSWMVQKLAALRWDTQLRPVKLCTLQVIGGSTCQTQA
jgi:hypothetical protein